MLIERIGLPSPTIGTLLAKARKRLRDEIDELFAGTPQVAGVLRAMLLGDRSFVDRAEAADFQKTGVFSRARCGRLARGSPRVCALLGGKKA